MIKSFAFLRSPLFLVAVAPFVLLAPVWLAGKALYWGTPSTQFIPWWWQAWQTLLAGELPLWNPLLGMGAPLLANYQSALIYPPNWIYLLLAAVGGLQWMAWGMAFLVAAHLAWAGWGMVKLAERLGLGELAQTIAGLAFSLSGYLVARAHFLSINAAVAWLPWILLAAHDLVQQPKSKRAVLNLSLLLALQWLAGHAQIAWYTLLLAVAWSIFWAWQRRSSRDLGRALLRFGTAIFFAFALSAIQLIPTAEYFLQSQRAAHMDAQAALTYSFWPWRFLTLLAPNFFGNPALGNYWGYGNYWEDAIYVGLLPLFLAIATVFFLRKANKQRPLILFLISLILMSFLLALGNNTPFFPWFFKHIPSFSLFQAPSRFSIWAIFALALLAALGAQRWRQPTGRALYWSRLAVAAGPAVVLGSALAAFASARGLLNIEPSFIVASASAGVFAIALAVLNLRAPKEGKPAKPVWTWLVVLFLFADLLYAGWGLNPGVRLDFYRQDPALHAALRAEMGEGRLYLPTSYEKTLKFQVLFRFDDFYYEDARSIRATLIPNLSLLEGFASANNFDPLLPARYQGWIEELDRANPEQQAKMLAQMSVAVVERLAPDEGTSVIFEPVEHLPRARWIGCATVENTSPYPSVSTQTTQSCSDQDAFVELRTSSANRVAIFVDPPQAGWLLLADTWYPGWHALANGEELTVYVADGIFRAVHLEPGQHDLVFVYRPSSFYIGLVLSALAWPTWLFLWRRWTK